MGVGGERADCSLFWEGVGAVERELEQFPTRAENKSGESSQKRASHGRVGLICSVTNPPTHRIKGALEVKFDNPEVSPPHSAPMRVSCFLGAAHW